MMRRIILLLMAMAMTSVVASGAAWALTKVGTNGPETLMGTNGADNLIGKGGNDRIFGLDGRDNLIGGLGKDLVMGGKQARDGDLFFGSGNKT
jgi:Ca2+-binding RTX toxin-like protein